MEKNPETRLAEGEEEYKMSIASLWTREVLELPENFVSSYVHSSQK